MFANIQMLRAIAAIIVIFHHITPHYKSMGGYFDSFEKFTTWGFTGVDIFFVISGFIMAHTTFRKERTFSNAKIFIKHRFARVYLGYWPFFVAGILFYGTATPNFLSEINLLGSFFLTEVEMSRLLFPISWSLSYELYFYAMFALLFAFSIKTTQIIIHVALVAMILRITFIWIDSGPQYFFLSHFLVEFFAGSFLYIHREKLKQPWMIALFFIFAVIAYVYGIKWDARNNALRVFTFGSGAFFIVALSITLENCKIFSAPKWITSIGDASYTIYLSHLLFISLFYFSGLRGFLSQQNTLIAEAGFFSYIAAIVLVSVVIYRKFELPIYRLAINTGHSNK